MTVKRILVMLCFLVGIGLVFSACDNPLNSDDDSGGSTQEEANGGENYTSATIGTLVYVPAGSFQRSATETDISIISRPFRMGEHQITQSQFEAIMVTNPSHFTSGDDAPNRPVDRVNWYDAIAFANKLSLLEGLTPVYSVMVDETPINWETLKYEDIPIISNSDWNNATADWDASGYRLPTEMEWMWAAMGADQDARAGAMAGGINRTGRSKPFAGHDGSNSVGDYAWSSENSGGTTRAVGSKVPNELGLYDMSGNVWEWNWDGQGGYPIGEVTDYRGAIFTSSRVKRGAGWYRTANFGTVANRGNSTAENRDSTRGFRLVRR